MVYFFYAFTEGAIFFLKSLITEEKLKKKPLKLGSLKGFFISVFLQLFFNDSFS